jgi:hypothetical protein
VGDIWVLVRSLRQFDRDDVLLKEVRKALREPVDPVRRRIKATAIATLPHSGGLGLWVAGTKITALITLRGKAAGIRLRGGRRSKGNLRGTGGGQTDVRAIDRGRLRHPSWGRRYRGQWFTQQVEPGFFTKTAAESPEWDQAIDRAMATAFGSIHA